MNNTEELKEAILDYIDSENIDYAMMINGEWGCGKTYFWKNIIVPKLKSNFWESQNKNRNKQNIYVSLYGLKSVDDIQDLVISKLVPLSNLCDFFKAITKAIQFWGIQVRFGEIPKNNYLQDQWLLNNASNLVLCFDDLERVNIDIKSVLGYINRFVEHYQIKTILICNEKELNKKSLDEYKLTKEKIVGYTFQFDPSLEEAVNNFRKNYSQYFQKIIKDNIKLILEIIEVSKTKNLRSVKNSLSIANEVFKELELKNIKLEDSIQEIKIESQLLCFIFSINLIIKSGKTDIEELRRFIKNPTLFMLNYKREEENSVPNNLPIYKFFENYYQSFTDFISVFGYMDTGYFNKKLFDEDIDKIKAKRKTNKEKFMYDFSCLSDDEFSQAANEWIEDLKNHNINDSKSLIDYSKYSERLIYYAQQQLISQTPQEIVNLFKQAIKNQFNNNSFDYQYLDFYLSKSTISDETIPNEFYGEIKNMIVDVNKKIQLREQIDKASNLIELLPENPEEFFFHKYNDNLKVPILKYIDTDKLFQKIIRLDNYNIRRFSSYIYGRYQNIDEYDNLKKLSDLLKDYVFKREKKLSTHLLTELYEELDKACAKLKPNN